jgi:hypothetical protein
MQADLAKGGMVLLGKVITAILQAKFAVVKFAKHQRIDEFCGL